MIGRIPQGMRGLKWETVYKWNNDICRIPRGMRGLKFDYETGKLISGKSRIPQGMRGLKCIMLHCHAPQRPSHPARDAWIEIVSETDFNCWGCLSHPARDAWIEIGRAPQRIENWDVASRKGCVD